MATDGESTDWVYGVAGERLIVLPLLEAQALADLSDAIASSETFGDFAERCASMGGRVAEWGLGVLDDKDVADLIPDLGAPLDLAVFGSEDGTFPPDPETVMLDCIAGLELDEEVGTEHDHMGGVPRLEIAADELPRVKALIEGEGIGLDERQDLIDRLWTS